MVSSRCSSTIKNLLKRTKPNLWASTRMKKVDIGLTKKELMSNQQMTIRSPNQDKCHSLQTSTSFLATTCSKSSIINKTCTTSSSGIKISMSKENRSSSHHRVRQVILISLSQIHMLATRSRKEAMMEKRMEDQEERKKSYLPIQNQRSLWEVLISSCRMKI